MNFTQSLVGTVIVSTIVAGTASNALAMNLVHSWDVTQFNSNDHAFTFFKHSGVKDLADDVDFQFITPGKLNEYDDGTARLTGTIVNQKNIDQRWDVDIRFDAVEKPDGNPKGKSSAHAIEHNWRFYELHDEQSGHMLTGLGEYDGSYLNLYDRSGGRYPGQLGLGANDKNDNMGFSFWFGYDGVVNGQRIAGVNDGDINVNLDPAPVPEPSLGLLSLGLLAGGYKLLKRDEEAAEA